MENSNRGRKNIPNEQNRLLYDPNERIRRNLGTFSMQQEIDEEDEIYEEIRTEEDNEIVENEPQIEDENEVVQQPKRQSAVKLLAHNAVKEVANKSIKAFIMKNPIVLVIIGIVLFLFLLILLILGFSSSNNGGLYSNMSSACSTSSDNANLITFLEIFEGSTGTCDNGNGYIAANLGDGTITVGPGITNYAIGNNYVKTYIESNSWQQYFKFNGSYYMNHNDCIPKSVVDKIKLYVIERNYASSIEDVAAKYGVTLTQYQKDAITSFNFNLGSGYTDDLIKAYSENGFEGLWNEMKKYVNATINGVYQTRDGLKKRRKAEFALFVTGDYTDQGLFYSRTLSNYDYYDSENVLARVAMCNLGGKIGDGFIVPLNFNDGFRCTSPFGGRIHPITKKYNYHNGLDLGANARTPIYASKAGTVIESLDGVTGSTPSTGNYVKILHDDGTYTRYLHMTVNSVKVKKGDRVEQGQQIGAVGTTGSSTGNHLHFEIYDSSKNLVDPYNYIDLSPLGDTSSCHY